MLISPHFICLEVNPQRRAEVPHEDPFGYPVDEACLSHCGVSGEHDLVGPVWRSGGLEVAVVDGPAGELPGHLGMGTGEGGAAAVVGNVELWRQEERIFSNIFLTKNI